jgi:hypothetical protein
LKAGTSEPAIVAMGDLVAVHLILALLAGAEALASNRAPPTHIRAGRFFRARRRGTTLGCCGQGTSRRVGTLDWHQQLKTQN